jgi:Protein of unknown function (DUF3293)
MEGFVFSGTSVSAFNRSGIPHSHILAYLATDYHIWGERPLVLRIGQRNEELAALFESVAVPDAAVIAAWNPWSQPTPAAENRACQNTLISELARRSLRHRPGQGVDPTGLWPPEDIRLVLVLGIDFATARQLGRQFRQNGFVWVPADAVPTLILLR